MGSRKKPYDVAMNGNGCASAILPNFRNLKMTETGGIIFSCTISTIKECLTKQLFGLPVQHFSYVKKIEPGMALFLFNYSDRKLHGIFEAASPGQMNIDPYGWTADGSRRTQYPAQVRVRVRRQCQPLTEEQFRPVIADNYYTNTLFFFELDHSQASKLISLLASSSIASSPRIPLDKTTYESTFPALPLPGTAVQTEWFDTHISKGKDEHYLEDDSDVQIAGQVTRVENAAIEEDIILKTLQQLGNGSDQHLSLKDSAKDSHLANGNISVEKNNAEDDLDSKENKERSCTSSNYQSIISQLVEEVGELKAFKEEHTVKMKCLEQKLALAERQIQWLNERCKLLESVSNPSISRIDETVSFSELHLDPSESIYLLGGYDGESWLSALDSYFPSQDVLKPLKQMCSIRAYFSVAWLHDELYVIGGGNGDLWYNTVESYNPTKDEWTIRPSLSERKGSLGGATVNDKIFVLGGGNGVECFSTVEMLDLDVGLWIPTRSMLQKRFSLAAAELNGALYATGGFDGNEYLKSAERFDPREHSWTKIPNMNSSRGCHTITAFNGKLYVVGGFDGTTMVSSTEVFDPRLGCWINGEPLKIARGYCSSAVVKESIYVIGGVNADQSFLDTVAVFKQGQGWEEINSNVIKKRCFLSVIAMQ